MITQDNDLNVKKPYARYFGDKINHELLREVIAEYEKNRFTQKRNRLVFSQRFLKQSNQVNIESIAESNKKLLHILKLSTSKVTYEDKQHNLLDDLKKISYVNGNRVVILKAEKAERISRIIENILTGGRHITSANRVDFVDAEPSTPEVPKLSAEEVQARRDEVREMVYLGKPKDGILLYRGRRGGDADAVSFFKQHYSRYIEPGQEVIFAPELGAIDPSLLASLRNECRSAANPMPVGTVEDRTNARIERRFSDGAKTERSTKVAASRRTVKKGVEGLVGMTA